MKYPYLENAPISEALIDIRVKLPEKVVLQHIETLHNFVKDDYPERKKRFSFKSTIIARPRTISKFLI